MKTGYYKSTLQDFLQTSAPVFDTAKGYSITDIIDQEAIVTEPSLFQLFLQHENAYVIITTLIWGTISSIFLHLILSEYYERKHLALTQEDHLLQEQSKRNRNRKGTSTPWFADRIQTTVLHPIWKKYLHPLSDQPMEVCGPSYDSAASSLDGFTEQIEAETKALTGTQILSGSALTRLRHFISFLPSKPRISTQFSVPEIPEVLFSTVKELITNSYKHANCNRIWISIFMDKGEIHLNYSDNGNCKKKRTKNGIGLTNLNRKILNLSGRINVTIQKGYSVNISIPYVA